MRDFAAARVRIDRARRMPLGLLLGALPDNVGNFIRSSQSWSVSCIVEEASVGRKRYE